MKAFVLYFAACMVAVALIGAIGWAFVPAQARPALLMSAGLAVVVQGLAFAVARQLRHRNLMVGWGLGSLLRLVVLVAYAVLVAKAGGGRMLLAPALLSFVAFLFVTTVFEPVFLKQ